ncbi:MAG: RdgB/HAM1 family non-canonical purine NTP pyrophosphatase [Betaproteobacteria bacterium]|nr:RdgB/HAM1 family non-canonical purine NTP pyrophosphatase [Betaproteobacteria bacterium]
MKQLVIASNNAGKLRELESLLGPLGIEVIAQSRLGIPEAEEPHATFIENALAKARHASQASALPALADDSGLCVEALQGALGVHSARFAGEPKSDERNNDLLLQRLADSKNRRAYYYCIVVLVRGPLDPRPLIAEGVWNGEILSQRRGSEGFGYDPLFLDPVLGKTAAELSLGEKNKVSHRGQALARLCAYLSPAPAV